MGFKFEYAKFLDIDYFWPKLATIVKVNYLPEVYPIEEEAEIPEILSNKLRKGHFVTQTFLTTFGFLDHSARFWVQLSYFSLPVPNYS